MTPELVFMIASCFALVGWLLLILIPCTKVTGLLVKSGLWSAILSLGYLIILSLNFGQEGGFQSLAAVAQLFSNPWVLLAGWIHYLAFDLFLGVWEVKEADALGIRRWILVPCLLLTFLFGPVGYLIFQVIRIAKGGNRASI
ncbi:ABA4-like family protein [Leptospira wolffii]|uniref:ABA4-like family protein n=1 Tax=Leptospira wolffii TaxID=409998 RepID=UPI00058BDB67|nr:ABA4-like family protein [Leptospira wolffii]